MRPLRKYCVNFGANDKRRSCQRRLESSPYWDWLAPRSKDDLAVGFNTNDLEMALLCFNHVALHEHPCTGNVNHVGIAFNFIWKAIVGRRQPDNSFRRFIEHFFAG